MSTSLCLTLVWSWAPKLFLELGEALKWDVLTGERGGDAVKPRDLEEVFSNKSGMTSTVCLGNPTAQPRMAPKAPWQVFSPTFPFQGPLTLVGGDYMLSKHRHHITQRTHGFCANLALGCRQYRPNGSGLSSQREETVRKEGQRSKKNQFSSKCCPLFIPGLPLLDSVKLPEGTHD